MRGAEAAARCFYVPAGGGTKEHRLPKGGGVVAAAMPEDRYAFKPWEGSLSFADHLRHIASVEKTLIQALRGGGWVWDQGITAETHPNRAAIEALLRESGEALREQIASMTDEELTRSISTPWGEATPADLLVDVDDSRSPPSGAVVSAPEAVRNHASGVPLRGDLYWRDYLERYGLQPLGIWLAQRLGCSLPARRSASWPIVVELFGWIPLFEALRRWCPVALATLSFLALGGLITASGMSDVLAEKAAALGRFYALLIPWIGGSVAT